MTTRTSSAAWRVWLITAGLVAVAAPVQLLALPGGRLAGGPRVDWWAVAVAIAVAESCVVHIRLGREARSFALGEIPFVIGLLVLPAPQLIAARLVGFGITVLRQRQAPVKAGLNLALWWASTVAAVLVMRVIAGTGGAPSMRAWLGAVAAMVLVGLLGTAVISAAMHIRGTRSSWDQLRRAVAIDSLISVANACFALVAFDVLRVDWRGGWALLVVAASLALGQRAHVALQRRHDSLQRMQDFARGVGFEETLEGVATRVLSEARNLIGVHEASIELDETFAGYEFVRRDGRDPVGTEELAVQLHSEGEPIGWLRVAGRVGDVGRLGREDRSTLEALAGHASIALQNGRLLDRLRAQIAENAHQATHDALTGLPNRLLFERLVNAQSNVGESFAVLLLDIDSFRDVNDTLGHAAGDRLLGEVGVRIRSVAPDGTVVARLGGDEFAVLLPGAGAAEATQQAERIRDALLHTMPLDDLTFSVGASIGVVVAPEHGSDSEALLRRADVAMYAAKDARSGPVVYDPAADQRSTDDLALVSDLRRAVTEGHLSLQYQPKVTLDGRQLEGVEALVRWRHPQRGVIGPDRFIPVAEQIGLMGPLTEYVLREALRQCRRWLDEGLDLGVAVNVSPRSLREPEFAARLRELLRAAAVPATRLTLEITEDAIMDDPEHAIEMLWQLRRLGVRVSVDDFGTGHSSLAYLQRLPVDEVKIDRCFVTGMLADPDQDTIVCGAIDLVHRLRRRVVAEGVEDERTFNRLAELGADLAQGYWMSRPLDAEDLAAWLAGWQARGGRVVGLIRREAG